MYFDNVMPTLVLPPSPTSDDQRLGAAALKLGWKVERHATNPPATIKDPVFYGEVSYSRRQAEVLGGRLIEPEDDWIAHVPENFLRREVFSTSLGDAYILKYPAFVKPAGAKAFKAKVYETGDELRQAGAPYDPTIMVLVSDPVNFEVEYRCFVLKNRIATASVYARKVEKVENELNEAVLFAHEVVYRMGDQCPAAFVLDVGRIEGRGWAVVDASPCWRANLYECDAAQVLRVLEHSLIRGRPS